MNKLIDYDNFLNWCKMWNKKPYQYKTLNEFIYETKQYNQPYNYEKNGNGNDEFDKRSNAAASRGNGGMKNAIQTD